MSKKITAVFVITLTLGFFSQKAKAQCYIYEHYNFGGSSFDIPGNYEYSNLGDWNDHTSSLRVIGPYQLVVFQHVDFNGESKVFTGDVDWIGDLWNDQISSLRCIPY